MDCKQIAKQLINESGKAYKLEALKYASQSTDLWEKCVILRKYTSPQSTEAEKLIRNYLKIGKPVDNTSGDGMKNGLNYEIKVSVHDKNCNFNIRQIRPHHNIHYYILVALNLFEDEYGKAYILKVPSKKLYELVARYGGYTHGTVDDNGDITLESILDKSNFFEYSLTPMPNNNDGTKSKQLWLELLSFEVEYKPENF